MELALFLVKNNVPYETAMSLPYVEAQAYAIIFNGFKLPKGGRYDFNRMKFVDASGKEI